VLPEPHINADVVKTATGFDVTLKSSVLARSVHVSFGELDATYSDNYIDLVPGVEMTIHVTSEASLTALRAALQIRSLADAFKPVAVEK